MGRCSNHYGSKCNFSCTIGYRLKGSSTLTCVASGNQHPGVWNKPIPTCDGKLKNLMGLFLGIKVVPGRMVSLSPLRVVS